MLTQLAPIHPSSSFHVYIDADTHTHTLTRQQLVVGNAPVSVALPIPCSALPQSAFHEQMHTALLSVPYCVYTLAPSYIRAITHPHRDGKEQKQ